MRSRSSVVLSLPVLLLACLILSANARAQDGIAFQPCESPTQMLQVLLDRQQAPLSHALPRIGLQPASFFIADGSGWKRTFSRVPVAASGPRREFTSAQFFGNGAQAAP